MDDDDDSAQRFDAMSIPELRRRVDQAVAQVRGMRHALAVHAGMTLEGMPGPIPEIDLEGSMRAFQEILEMLPMRRTLMTPQERAKLRPMSSGALRRMDEVIEELSADPEAFDAAAAEAELDLTSADIRGLRESRIKCEMLVEVTQEIKVLMAELERCKEAIEQSSAALVAKIVEAGGATN